MGTIIGIIVGVAFFVGIVIFTFLDYGLYLLIQHIRDKRIERLIKSGKWQSNYEVKGIALNGNSSSESLSSQISRGVADGLAHYDVAHGNSQGNSSYGGW